MSAYLDCDPDALQDQPPALIDLALDVLLDAGLERSCFDVERGQWRFWFRFLPPGSYELNYRFSARELPPPPTERGPCWYRHTSEHGMWRTEVWLSPLPSLCAGWSRLRAALVAPSPVADTSVDAHA